MNTQTLHCHVRQNQFFMTNQPLRSSDCVSLAIEFGINWLDLGLDAFPHLWIDRRTLRPARGRIHAHYRAILDYIIARVRGLPGPLKQESIEMIGFGALLPLTRDIGANQVIADAMLHRSQIRVLIRELQKRLKASADSRMPTDEFARLTRGTIGPDDFRTRLGSRYDEMTSEFIALVKRDYDLFAGTSFPTAHAKWREWTGQYYRRRYHAIEIDVMNAISLEARTAFIQIYSSFWCDLLNCLGCRYGPAFYRFHRIWHTERRITLPGETQPTHLFEGHTFALHSAGSLLMKTSAGRELMAPLVAGNADAEAEERFLAGMFQAVSLYTEARQESLAGRRGMRRVELRNASILDSACARRR